MSLFWSGFMRLMLALVVAIAFVCVVTFLGAPQAEAADDSDVRASGTEGETMEKHLPEESRFTSWVSDPSIFDVDSGDRRELREVVEQDTRTIKLENLVPPIYFGQGDVRISDRYIAQLQEVLETMRERQNVRLHFIGHADALPLSESLEAVYGDNAGLSRERAGTAAEYCQKALGLPAESVSYEGRGSTRPVADNGTEAGRRLNRRVEVQVWYDEISERTVEKEVIVPTGSRRVKVCRTETVCMLRYREGHNNRARIRNLVTPLHYDEGMTDLPETFLRQIGQAMRNLAHKENVTVKFIAFADNQPLTGRKKRIYGDPTGFTKAVARRVAFAARDHLGLSENAVVSEGKGASRPVAANDTPRGRTLNRRVEVEFWHDDPLQDLPDEPQLCPDAAGAETVTRVYPVPGGIDPILFENGDPVIPAGYTLRLRRIMDEIADRGNVRLRFTGYINNERMSRRATMIYGDDIGLSMARSRRAMEAVSAKMQLDSEQAEFDGRGYVQSHDVINAGFIESDMSRVEVQIVYDEPVLLDQYEGVEVTPMTREVDPANPFALNLMRITVDGKPLDDPQKCRSDVQRCTDVALEDARIRFRYDSLNVKPRLNVTAWPRTVGYRDLPATAPVENLVRFRLYSNYRSFIEKAEVRIFEDGRSRRSEPFAVIAMDDDGMARWKVAIDGYSAPLHKLNYVVRVYGPEEKFDETEFQELWVVDRVNSPDAENNVSRELLTGYGESRLATRNISLEGGSVLTYGSAIPENHTVWLAGYPVPVDANGRFVAEEILPTGMHTVEVAVLDEAGNGELFLRDFELKKSDWFTVGIADLTISGDETDGPADLLDTDDERTQDDTNVEGRLAYYTTGKFGNGWSLTSSADTREGSVDEIFSNFVDKSPDALFRRLDPEDHMPTFGDDSTLIEDAPTSGKFYLKVEKERSRALWGNYHIVYTDNELAHVDRGLYGANLHYETIGTTTFGEPRFLVDGFAADPGTVAARDELTGTGGSLYYLKRQNILEGSERLRVEVRDKDSGIVLQTRNLVPALDYDIDYLQGRVLLTEPLSSTADDGMLVQDASLAGHRVYLVARYEFTPGFEDPDIVSTGGTAHIWLNDHVRVGMTGNLDSVDDNEDGVAGADLTLRKTTGTWLRVEAGRTNGPGMSTAHSVDGGYDFEADQPVVPSNKDPEANSVEASIRFGDLLPWGRGRATIYRQEFDAGYAAPGVTTNRDLLRYGGSAELPVGERVELRLKADRRIEEDGLETDAGEVDLDFRTDEHWTASAGVRLDRREDNSTVVPATQEEGRRTDAVVRLLYDSKARWNSYGFLQDTVATSGNRDENQRAGIGGRYRLTDRFSLSAEASGGDLGAGGRLETEYLYSDRTTVFANYNLENERTDNGLRARRGNMTSGFRTRYSDSATVFVEERYAHGDVPTGLMHSAGVDLAPTDRLNLGANIDLGRLKDPRTSAETRRRAMAVSAGYGLDAFKISSAVEYRRDENEQPDANLTERTTWLFRNSMRFQLTDDWRLIGTFNHSRSEHSLGNFYEGEFTEAVMGVAFRPVGHDRLNALLKYTYFHNQPAADIPLGASTDIVSQRSHIGALDVMYDVSERWTIGGKYAYRNGEVSVDPTGQDTFSSRAHLYVLRADWHFIHRWDVLVEGRMLDLPDAEDRLSGALAGVYRHVGNHLKLGLGYNFSEFSDDLTDLDYDRQGLFVNIVGKY